MAEKRTTKRDNYNRLMEVVNTSNVADKESLKTFIGHELELLDRKRITTPSANSKAGKVAAENEVLKASILEVLHTDKGLTCSEVNTLIGGELSTSKVSALLKSLMAEGKVKRTVEKKKALFKRAWA